MTNKNQGQMKKAQPMDELMRTFVECFRQKKTIEDLTNASAEQ